MAVSVVGAAINHKNELMLTLSDGTILTPGRIGREAEVSICRTRFQRGGRDDARSREIQITATPCGSSKYGSQVIELGVLPKPLSCRRPPGSAELGAGWLQ